MSLSRDSRRIGVWWSDKKNQKISISELELLFQEKGYALTKIDLNAPIEPQGPFEAIIHKLSDVVVRADQGNDTAVAQVKAFEDYMKSHSDMIIFDDLDNVRKLLDRYKQYKLIDESELAREDGVFTPTFVELTTTDVSENLSKLSKANVRFPFVCKPLLAHGSSEAHQMSLIFSEKGLKDINPPCVAQTFINHDARLFKLFIIKNQYYVIERPSLKNFRSGDYDTVYFDSHDISKPNSSSALTELDEKDQINKQVHEPETDRFDRIVNVVCNKLGLYLLGIDVIIENKSGRYAIIDMNSFPGYDGVDNFLGILRDVVIEDIEAKNNINCPSEGSSDDGIHMNRCLQSMQSMHSVAVSISDSPPVTSITSNANSKDVLKSLDKTVMTEKVHNGNDIDSGIDTSDSCDEKKIKKQPQMKVVRRQHSRSFTSTSCVRMDNYNSI